MRVVSMGEFSLELCGGTHVQRTGDIGSFRIVSEGGIAAGVRRVEALTGAAARRYLSGQDARVRDIAGALKVGQSDVTDRVAALIEEKRRLERELAETRKKLAMGGSDGGDAGVKEIGGIKVRAIQSGSGRKPGHRASSRVATTYQRVR